MYTRIAALALVVALAASLAAPTVYALPYMAAGGPGEDEHGRRGGLRGVFGNISYSTLLSAFFDVRNESLPLLRWAEDYNVTLASRIEERAEFHYNRSLYYNSTGDERLAKIHVFIATMVYAHAPVTAYIVLGYTIKSSLGENGSITSGTVEAVLARASELRGLVMQARGYALNHSVTLPYIVDALIARAEWRISVAERLLANGSIRPALRNAVIGYRLYVKAYAIIIYATIISDVFNGDRGFYETVVHAIYPRATDTLARILPMLPPRIRERIKHEIKTGTPPTAILERLRSYLRELHKKTMNISDEKLAHIITRKLLEALRHMHGRVWREYAAALGYAPYQYRMIYNATYTIILNIIRDAENTSETPEELIGNIIESIRSWLENNIGFPTIIVDAIIMELQVLITIQHHGHHG